MIEEFQAAGAGHLHAKRNKHVREASEVYKGIWANEPVEYHGEFVAFDRCGFGVKPVQKSRPPIRSGGIIDPRLTARAIARYGLKGWIGIQDTPEAMARWRSAIKEELEKSGSPRSVDDVEMSSTILFEITQERTDQTLTGKGSIILVGTGGPITDNLKRLRAAGLTRPLRRPPFKTPGAKVIGDLRTLSEGILAEGRVRRFPLDQGLVPVGNARIPGASSPGSSRRLRAPRPDLGVGGLAAAGRRRRHGRERPACGTRAGAVSPRRRARGRRSVEAGRGPAWRRALESGAAAG